MFVNLHNINIHLLIVANIKYITLRSYALYLSPKRGFEHVTEYRPKAEAEGRYSVTYFLGF